MRLILDLTDDNNSVLDICTTFTIPQLDNHSAREKKHSTFGNKWIHYSNGVTHKYALA